MIVVADPDAEFRDWVTAHLEAPDGLLPVMALREAEDAATRDANDVSVVIVGPNFDVDLGLATLERIHDRRPAVGSILVTDSDDPQTLRAALRIGIRGVLSTPVSVDDLQETVKRAKEMSQQLRERRGGPEPGADVVEGQIVTVFSTKGGCGKSLVASNLAVLLAQETNQKIALVDLDLQSGDLAIMMQLLPALSIYDAAQNIDRLDPEALAGYLTPHRAGVSLLAAPLEPSLAEAVPGDAVEKILEFLRVSFPYVVVDGPALFTEQVLSALDVTDTVVLVTSMDVPSIKNLKLALNTLAQLGIGRDRIRLVLNRADSKVGLRIGEVEKTLGTEVDIAIPSSRDVPLSVNQGTPLAVQRGKSPVVAAIHGLVEQLQVEPAERKRSRRRRRGD